MEGATAEQWDGWPPVGLLWGKKKGGSLPCLFVTYVHSSVHITLGLLPRKEKKTNFVWDGPKKWREVESEGENSNESSAVVSKVGGETILFF